MAGIYVPRLADRLVGSLLAELPAVMVVGPRGVGKTTSSARRASAVVRLDRPADAVAFRSDPDAALRAYDEPLLIDEWQVVPEVLAAVKRAVDDDHRAGRFVLTGSVRAELLNATWAATGRVVRVEQWGMVEREVSGDATRQSFFDLLFDGQVAELGPAGRLGLVDYVELALRSGFPELVNRSSPALRRRWLASYVDQLVMRDAALADADRDPVRLRRYLSAVATNTAGVVAHRTLYDAAGVTRPTAVAYDALLELLFAHELVPAWHTNRLNRLSRTPKRYLIEPALVGPLLGVDARAAIRNGDVLGRLIDTFVVAQLRPELDLGTTTPRLYHLRHDDGRYEVDLVAEAPDGRIVAFEIKATATPAEPDARHLRWLREQLGDDFACGVVFHTGPLPIKLSDRIWALPISCLWG